MEFRVLGSLAAVAGGAEADLGQPKQRALLAILLLHPGQIVPVDRLISLLWGEGAPRTALHSIEMYVSGLRRALEALGPSDVIVKATSDDVDSLGKLVVAKIQAIDGITRTLTCPVVHL